KAPTIGRHIVRAARGAGAEKVAPLEELRWRAGVPGRAHRLHRNGQQFAAGTDIEQFLAVPRPERSRSPCPRNLPLAAARVRKWPDEDFVPTTGTVRLVRQPAAVGRDDPV